MKGGRKTVANPGGDDAAEAARAPTMIDVAARAGVSQTTVSLVLNNSQGARLSASTRSRSHRPGWVVAHHSIHDIEAAVVS